jgi:uncharacterized membrane protein YedE/YeeE
LIVSLLLAVVNRQFKISPPAKGMVKMAMIGGALMGLGVIMAYGCNIGQGLSGISTLSIESIIAFIGMILGNGWKFIPGRISVVPYVRYFHNNMQI